MGSPFPFLQPCVRWWDLGGELWFWSGPRCTSCGEMVHIPDLNLCPLWHWNNTKNDWWVCQSGIYRAEIREGTIRQSVGLYLKDSIFWMEGWMKLLSSTFQNHISAGAEGDSLFLALLSNVVAKLTVDLAMWYAGCLGDYTASISWKMCLFMTNNHFQMV